MLLNRIHDAIDRSGQTRYAIAKGSGVAQSQLSRFVHGERGLTVEAIERLAEHLGLEIVVRPKRTARRGK